jgi:hypothetical protein
MVKNEKRSRNTIYVYKKLVLLKNYSEFGNKTMKLQNTYP